MKHQATEPINPCRIDLPRVIAAPLEWILGLHKLAAINDDVLANMGTDKLNVHQFLDLLIARTAANKIELHDIPQQGPLIIMCNHPLGGLEGIMLFDAILKHRSDVKVLTNSFLCRIPHFKDYFVGVDVVGKQDKFKNIAGLKQMFSHVKQGGAALVFPAGRVARYSLKHRKVQEFNWNVFVGKMALKYQANCLPLYFNGSNSKAFYFLSLLHPVLGTMMLPREMANKKNSKVSLLQGKLILPNEAQLFASAADFTHYVQMRSQLLFEDSKEKQSKLDTKDQQYKTPKVNLQQPETDAKLTAEVATLADYLIFEKREFSVYCAPSEKIDAVRHYVGRGRAQSFPGLQDAVAIDLDHYDDYYHQLFMWDNNANCIVGGYRIGHVGSIVEKYGVKGLYCHSLFNFKKNHLPDYKNSIEVGRSYIHPKYQRNIVVLDSIWKAIGIYTIKMSRAHTLYGGVCVGVKESKILARFIAEAILLQYKFRSKKTQKIKPRNPMQSVHNWDSNTMQAFRSIPAINKLVGSINEKVAVETLVKHYLNLNGKIVSFTVNPYLKSLDGLIIVDLRQTERKRIKKFIGEELLLDFEKQWNLDENR